MVTIKKFILLVLTIVLVGCAPQTYLIKDVSLEKTDLEINKQYDNVKVYYTIENNAELTLNSKISVNLNETCFQKITDVELGALPPKQNTRVYTAISLSWNRPDSCKNKIYPIQFFLRDVNGKELYKTQIQIGIV